MSTKPGLTPTDPMVCHIGYPCPTCKATNTHTLINEFDQSVLWCANGHVCVAANPDEDGKLVHSFFTYGGKP